MHHLESYCGVKMSKLPEDLRIYQHLVWQDGVDTVIEIGTKHGGSAMWFRDVLGIHARYGRISDFRVITIDIEELRTCASWPRGSRPRSRTGSEPPRTNVEQRRDVEFYGLTCSPGGPCSELGHGPVDVTSVLSGRRLA
jgi:hypothetical protein